MPPSKKAIIDMITKLNEAGKFVSATVRVRASILPCDPQLPF
jgi:hypothetical protein